MSTALGTTSARSRITIMAPKSAMPTPSLSKFVSLLGDQDPAPVRGSSKRGSL